MSVCLFCVPGKHTGPEVGDTLAEKQRIPGTWRIVSARYQPRTQNWYYDPQSPMTIPVCSLHTVAGEPLELVEPVTDSLHPEGL